MDLTDLARGPMFSMFRPMIEKIKADALELVAGPVPETFRVQLRARWPKLREEEIALIWQAAVAAAIEAAPAPSFRRQMEMGDLSASEIPI